MEDTFENQVARLLGERGLTLATAESCTGGLISHRLTNLSGASTFFLGGVVAYANQTKINLLGVSPATLENHGAVSSETVIEMARGARRAFGVDLAVSVSGIAGPGGAVPGKPVGTTWIGMAAESGAWSRQYLFKGDRRQNKSAAADAALMFLIDYLMGNEVAGQL